MKHIALTVVLLCGVVAGCQVKTVTTVSSDVRSHRAGIAFQARIPIAKTPMPLFRLKVDTAQLPVIRAVLESETPGLALQPLGATPLFRKAQLSAPDHVWGASRADHVWVRLDTQTGDVRIHPALADRAPATLDKALMLERAQKLFERLIADDKVTSFELDDVRVLHGSTVEKRDGQKPQWVVPRATYLGYIAVRRKVGPLYVDGPGSRGLAVLRNHQLEGLTLTWRSARVDTAIEPSATEAEVEEAIRKELAPYAERAAVTVTEVRLMYYDGEGDFLQPVYRFSASVLRAGRLNKNPDYVHGYVPIGKAPEPLPSLRAKMQESPRQPENVQMNTIGARQLPLTTSGIVRLGRYVVRNDLPGWVQSANEFANALTELPTSRVVNHQYYWAEPRLFDHEADRYIDSVDLALVEAHGDYGQLFTDGVEGGEVDLQTLTRGYGALVGGTLTDWIVHACAVIPGPDDLENWLDPWWIIFKGVRTVLGYRTEMLITDRATSAFGASIREHEPSVSSWFNTLQALDVYAGNDRISSGHPLGRPSAITLCDHDDDSIFLNVPTTDETGRCLKSWWIAD